jgi:hypothetical protein
MKEQKQYECENCGAKSKSLNGWHRLTELENAFESQLLCHACSTVARNGLMSLRDVFRLNRIEAGS